MCSFVSFVSELRELRELRGEGPLVNPGPAGRLLILRRRLGGVRGAHLWTGLRIRGPTETGIQVMYPRLSFVVCLKSDTGHSTLPKVMDVRSLGKGWN